MIKNCSIFKSFPIFVFQILNMAVKTVIDTRDEIVSHLKEIERSLMWLSKKTEIPYGTIYSTLIQKVMALSQTNLDKMNDAMDTGFTLNG